MLERADGAAFDLEALKARLEATLHGGDARPRRERRLQRAGARPPGLQWRDVALMRTISRFLRQVRVAYSQDYMWATLRRAFRHRGADRAAVPSRASIRASRSRRTSAPSSRPRSSPRSRPRSRAVESLDEDRILRHFVNAVTSALRTNFYQTDEAASRRPTIAIKFDSRKIDGLPLPKPLYEIFVYSPRVEGVHLRFGKVARGGIRWSDRPQDFRTEVLGLVKAQQVKNAVIVPVGAKGGFVPKQLAGGPARRRAGRRHRRLHGVHLEPARHHRQSRARRRHSPRERRAPRRRRSVSRWSRPTRAPRRSRIPRTASRSSTASGSATRSPAAARPATTTRRWASRRAAPGRPCGAISARWTSTSARRRSRSRASATCRATCSATACCASAPSSWSRRSITATSSSIPNPDPERSFTERAAPVRSLALELAGLQQGLSLGGRRHLFAQGEGDRAERRGARAARARRREVHAAAGDDRDPQAQHRSASGSAASAPTSAPSSETDDQVGDRVNDPIRITGAARALQGGRRGRQSRRDAARPRRGGDARRAAQHRRDRQFGRRQHLRRRGQHQDRAQPADARRHG